MTTTLIIPAAGRGVRFCGDQPKQLLPLYGRPVLSWSLAAFSGLVDDAVIATAADLRGPTMDAVAAAEIPFPVVLVDGGATRLESVDAALR
nr:2-C-methyl-D-erythritol 4-phosphate cytidylyltransferase [Planctomycetota bacterium]